MINYIKNRIKLLNKLRSVSKEISKIEETIGKIMKQEDELYTEKTLNPTYVAWKMDKLIRKEHELIFKKEFLIKYQQSILRRIFN